MSRLTSAGCLLIAALGTHAASAQQGGQQQVVSQAEAPPPASDSDGRVLR